MAIQQPLRPGTIVLCNYDTGFRAPEMVKRRPVVVVSPRLPYRDGLCTVVPLSTSAPRLPLSYVCKIVLQTPLSRAFSSMEMWAKTDMLATVGFYRLDLFQTDRDQTGRRRYLYPRISHEELTLIHRGIMYALGIQQ